MTRTSSRTAVVLSLLLAVEPVSAFAPSRKHATITNSVALSDANPATTTQLFSGMMGRGNGNMYSNNNQRREEIVAFQVTTVFDQEELLARERDQPMFTPAVRRDIYRILRSPYNPSLGDGPMGGGPNMFGTVLLAKSSDNNGPNAAWDTFAFATKGANPSGFVILDDDQMLEAISSIGKITPVALAITQAFEAYLSQIIQLYWGEPEAAQLSVEFLVAFGNELTQRLDINNRIRSTRLSPQEIEVLHQQPFANFVDSESLENFQGETMRGMNLDAIRSAPPPEIIPLAGNYGNSDLGLNSRSTNGPAYNQNNSNSNTYGRNTYGNNGNNNNYGPGSGNSNAYGNNPYGQSPPPPQQNAPMPPPQQPGYNGQNGNMDFNRHNDNNSYNPNARSYGRGNTYSGNTNDSRNFGHGHSSGNSNTNNYNGSYGGMPDQGRPLQGRTDGYNQNANSNNQYGSNNNNDGIRSNSKLRGYDNANGMNNSNNNNGMGNNPNRSYGNNNNNGSYGYGNSNNNNPQPPYGDNRGPPMQSAQPDNFGNNMNFSGRNNNNNSYNNNGGNNSNNNNNNYGNNNNGGTNTYSNSNGLYESVRRGAKRDNALWDDSPNNNRDRGWYENI